MVSARLKSLEASAHAAGSAFGCSEDDFEQKFIPPVRPGRIAAVLLVLGGGSAALVHHFGLGAFFTSLGGWRASI